MKHRITFKNVATGFNVKNGVVGADEKFDIMREDLSAYSRFKRFKLGISLMVLGK